MPVPSVHRASSALAIVRRRATQEAVLLLSSIYLEVHPSASRTALPSFVPLAYSSFYRQQILRASAPFLVLPVDCFHILHHAFMEVMDLFRFLCHRNDLVAKCMDGQKRGWRAEPRIEQDVTRRNRRLLCFLQEPQYDLGCFPLCQFPLFCAIGAGIYVPRGCPKTVRWILGGKKCRLTGRSVFPSDQQSVSIRKP